MLVVFPGQRNRWPFLFAGAKVSTRPVSKGDLSLEESDDKRIERSASLSAAESSAMLRRAGMGVGECAEIGRLGGREAANYPTQAKTRLEWAPVPSRSQVSAPRTGANLGHPAAFFSRLGCGR